MEHLYLQKINELVFKQAGTINLEKIVRVVVEEELFDVLKETHRSLMHGRVVKMEKAMESKYANISRNVIKQFLKLCPRCIEGAPRISSRAGIKPILTKGFNRRGQVDLIDFQSHPDEGMAWLLVYQDHGVKFAHFVPLPDKKARTVAEALLKIFSIQGAPVFLQSDNGREFVNSIFEEFKVMWPGLKIIHGRPRHSQSQGSVERLNQTAERMLQKWCADTGKGGWLHAFMSNGGITLDITVQALF